MKRLLLVSACVSASALSSSAVAYVSGGTNFGYSGYPEPSCYAPTKPSMPYSRDSYAIDRYNNDVEYYNTQARVYFSCIRDYLDNADNDIKRIKEKAQAAIDEANSL